jgi:hypothetical protein
MPKLNSFGYLSVISHKLLIDNVADSSGACSLGVQQSILQRFLSAIFFWPSYPELFRQRGEPPIAQWQWLAFGS